MDQTLAVRYGGRAAGAALAYYTVGRKLDTLAMIAVVALGWLAGGYAIDSYQATAGAPKA